MFERCAKEGRFSVFCDVRPRRAHKDGDVPSRTPTQDERQRVRRRSEAAGDGQVPDDELSRLPLVRRALVEGTLFVAPREGRDAS